MSIKNEPVSLADETLIRIAGLLRCPVEGFVDDSQAPADLKGVSELIAIWQQLDEGLRDCLLQIARDMTTAA